MGFGVCPADQHGELVATQARDHVVGTHMLAQALADTAQHQVAGIVAVTVVDRLEVVEIDQHQRHRLATAIGVGHGRLDLLDQVAAVRQFGQRVVECRMLQFLLTLAELLVGLGQFGSAVSYRRLQLVCTGLHLRHARGLLATRLLQGFGFLLFEHLDAVGQGKGEEDRLCCHRQGKDVGVPGGGLHQPGGAHQGQADAAENQAVAKEIEQGRKVALAPADHCGAKGGRDAGKGQQGDDPGSTVALPQAFQRNRQNITGAGKAQQVVCPAYMAAGLQQGLGEAASAETPERGQGDTVQPEGYGIIRPQILEAMAAHAEDHQQGAGGGQYVPEIGRVAQAEKDEQVVQQQGGDDAVDHAQCEVFLGGQLGQIIQLPGAQGEGVAGRVVAAQVKGQWLLAQLRQLEQHVAVIMVAAALIADALARFPRLPAAHAIRQKEAQIELGDRADLQPPLAWCVAGGLQADLDPPGVAALADTGLAGGWHETLLHGRVGHVGDAQLAAGIFQQLDLSVQLLPAAAGLQQDWRGHQLTAEARQAGPQEYLQDCAPHRLRSLNPCAQAGL